MKRPLGWPAQAGRVLVEAGLLLVLPLLFSRSFSEQFTYPKRVLSEALIIVAALTWILGRLWGKSRGLRRSSPGGLAWPLLLLSVAVLISCFNSPVPAFSLRDSVYFLCGPVWALVLMGWTGESSETEVRRIYTLGALGGSIVAVIAVLQWAGHDPLLFGGYSVEWKSMVARMRLYGTFGNPNFVAGYLIATVFLAAAQAAHSARLVTRAAWSVAAAVMLAAKVGTGSRGAWMGLVAGIVVAGVVLKSGSGWPAVLTLPTAWQEKPPARSAFRRAKLFSNRCWHLVLPRRVSSVSSAPGEDLTQRSLRGLVSSVLKLEKHGGHGDANWVAAGARFASWVAILPGSVCLALFSAEWRKVLSAGLQHLEGRVFLWRSAWPMFGEHPILGSGWATFQLRFLDLQARALAAQPEMLRHWSNIRQLHNDLLQLLLETGLLGLLAFGWLLWTYASGVKHSTVPAPSGRLWLAASAGGVTAVLVDSLFNFQFAIPPTFILMFTLLAVPVMLASPETPSGVGGEAAAATGASRLLWLSAWRWAASLGVVAGAALLLLQVGREAVAERDYALGRELETRGETARAEEVYRHGLRANPLNGRLHFGLARVLYLRERYPEALSEVPLAERTFADSHLEVLKARIQDQMGLVGPALAAYRRALALDPTLKTVQADIERLSGAKPL